MLAASILAAGAQPAPAESLVGKATISRDVIQKFVASFATPTHMTGKIAPWENGVCPLTVGQQPAVTKFVTGRVRDVAAMVGAPVGATQSCTPNIEIVFTKIPQELLDNVRKNQVDYLGYAQSGEIEKLATVTRPVQAWYTTQTRDRKGMSRIDSARRLGTGITMSNFTALGRNRDPIDLPDATYASVTGDHISDGVRSAFYHIIIVADINRLGGYEAGPLADYIAMLALTQLNSLDTCQQLPSIENMLAKGCEAKAGVLTGNDIAYLRGVYSMSSDRQLLRTQMGEIADRMSETLGGR
jgi:hypothetical protein